MINKKTAIVACLPSVPALDSEQKFLRQDGVKRDATTPLLRSFVIGTARKLARPGQGCRETFPPIVQRGDPDGSAFSIEHRRKTLGGCYGVLARVTKRH
jgi:hypothetical protein